MRTTKTLSTFAALLLLFTTTSMAQQRLSLGDSVYADGALRYFTLSSAVPQKRISEAPAILTGALKTDQNTSFRFMKTKSRDGQVKTVLYQQLYKGVPVYDGYYYLRFKNDIFIDANGEYTPIDAVANTATISKNLALKTAGAAGKKEKPLSSTAELILWRSDRQDKYRYVYEVKVTYASAALSTIVMIDAATGKILVSVPVVCSVNIACTGTTLYSGTQNFTGDTFGGGVRLRQARNGVNISTLNNQNNTTINAVDFVNANTTWTSAGINAGALDVHFGTEQFLDYFRTVFSRNSIDNAGRAIESYTNVWDAVSGAPMDNAYFDPGTISFSYGQGQTIFSSVTSLDVVAHEMAHGMAFFEVGFNNTGEAASLNEGFSDIWGATVENWSGLPGKQTWTMGEEIMANGFSCLRSLRNPQGEGFIAGSAVEGNYPDTRSGPGWAAGNNPPHRNATVLGHWYFLLSQGGSDTNGIGNAFNVGGLGINTAADIAYNTELALTPAADFASVRVASIAYATSEWGANSCEVREVTNAWHAVGVGAAYSGTLGLSISGDNDFCTTSGSYTIPALPGTWSVQWSAVPSGSVTINTPNASSTTLDKNYDATLQLRASVTPGCSSVPLVITKNVIAGFPPYPGPVGADTAWPNGNYYYTVNLPLGYPPASSYWWTVPSGWTILSGQGTDWLYVRTGTTGGAVEVEVTACGVARPTYKYVEIGSGSWIPDRRPIDTKKTFRLSPNPAGNLVTIAMQNVSRDIVGKKAGSYFTAITIYDMTGGVKKRLRYTAGTTQVQVDISDLRPGAYIVELSNDREAERQQLIIQK